MARDASEHGHGDLRGCELRRPCRRRSPVRPSCFQLLNGLVAIIIRKRIFPSSPAGLPSWPNLAQRPRAGRAKMPPCAALVPPRPALRQCGGPHAPHRACTPPACVPSAFDQPGFFERRICWSCVLHEPISLVKAICLVTHSKSDQAQNESSAEHPSGMYSHLSYRFHQPCVARDEAACVQSICPPRAPARMHPVPRPVIDQAAHHAS